LVQSTSGNGTADRDRTCANNIRQSANLTTLCLGELGAKQAEQPRRVPESRPQHLGEQARGTNIDRRVRLNPRALRSRGLRRTLRNEPPQPATAPVVSGTFKLKPAKLAGRKGLSSVFSDLLVFGRRSQSCGQKKNGHPIRDSLRYCWLNSDDLSSPASSSR
jgi:hypothetical protein